MQLTENNRKSSGINDRQSYMSLQCLMTILETYWHTSLETSQQLSSLHFILDMGRERLLSAALELIRRGGDVGGRKVKSSIHVLTKMQ